jgi:hypothetical protein
METLKKKKKKKKFKLAKKSTFLSTVKSCEVGKDFPEGEDSFVTAKLVKHESVCVCVFNRHR